MSKLERLDDERVVISADAPRGTFISPEELEEVLGCERASVEYGLSLMRMCRRFRLDTKQAGDPKMIRCEAQGLRIMTDEECASYTPKLVNRHLVSAVNAGRRGIETVRPDHLGSEQRAKWDRFTEKWSMIEQTAQAAADDIHALGLYVEAESLPEETSNKALPPASPRPSFPSRHKPDPVPSAVGGGLAFGQTWYGPNPGGNRDRPRRRIINIRFGKPRGKDFEPHPEHVWYVDEHGRIGSVAAEAFQRWAKELTEAALPLPPEETIRKAISG